MSRRAWFFALMGAPQRRDHAWYRDVVLPEVLREHLGTLADVKVLAVLPRCTRSVLAMAAILLTLAPPGASACVGLLG